MRTRCAVAVAFGLTVLFMIGCKGITTPSNNQTETFSGSLQPQAFNRHPFSTGRTGELTVKLTAWAPNSNILAGVAWVVANNDGTCTNSVLQQNNFVVVNAQAIFGQIVSGKYCIVVFDPGTLTAAQSYTITVSHP